MATAHGERRFSPEVFRLLRDLIYEYCGIHFADDNAYIIHRRLQPRLDSLALGDYADYYRYLRSCDGPARKQELEEIVDRVTNNETYFFRESYQLQAFRDEILPELYKARPRRRRRSVWSAGCASGEEAYTIAILITEAGLFADADVRGFCNDISRRCRSAARKGQDGCASFSATHE